MGTSKSCLPVKWCACHHSPRRHSTLKRRSRTEELFRNNAIDLNRASPDELLFLPGITRPLALSIVAYRNANHGFKHKSEILKVDGMTWLLFKRICDDVQVSSLPPRPVETTRLDLNAASYAELCAVPGVTPSLAAEIIEQRERHGPFRSIEDLRQVKGADENLVGLVRERVTLNPRISLASEAQLYFTPCAADARSLTSLILDTIPAELQAKIAASPPPPARLLSLRSGKGRRLRFASWNLQRLTVDKVQNPGVREVICRTILANNFSLVGIQEIGSKDALDVLVKELNNPTMSSVRQQSDRSRGQWRCVVSDVAGATAQGSEHLGFLYDESAGVRLKEASLFSSPAHFARSPYISTFRIGDSHELVCVNVHLKARTSNASATERPAKEEVSALPVLAQAMDNTIEQDHVMIFGGLNASPTAEECKGLMQCQFSPMITENTDIGLQAMHGAACVDNIWLSAEAKTWTTGDAGVIRDGLSSIWIPTGWTWGGLVSDHCPIWIEFDLA